MRFRTSAAIAVGVVTAGLCVAGCQSSTSGASGTASSAPAATESASVPPVPPQPSGSPGPSGAGASGSGTAGQGAGQAGSGGQGVTADAPCQTSQLRFTIGAYGPSQGSGVLRVDLINAGPVACTMDGYPGVNLSGTVAGKSGYQWPLERGTAVKPSKVTLAGKGGAAHFTINYLAWSSGDGGEIKVSQIIVTPPDQYTHGYVPWSQAVVLQDGATHSGTWIEPVQPGA